MSFPKRKYHSGNPRYTVIPSFRLVLIHWRWKILQKLFWKNVHKPIGNYLMKYHRRKLHTTGFVELQYIKEENKIRNTADGTCPHMKALREFMTKSK